MIKIKNYYINEDFVEHMEFEPNTGLLIKFINKEKVRIPINVEQFDEVKKALGESRRNKCQLQISQCIGK